MHAMSNLRVGFFAVRLDSGDKMILKCQEANADFSAIVEFS